MRLARTDRRRTFLAVLLPIALLALIPGCRTSHEFIFGPVIQIDAPWRYENKEGAPLTLGVVHGDKHPVALEALTLTRLEWPTDAAWIDGRREIQEREENQWPDYVALLRRDEGERFASRPLESDALLATTPHVEINFVKGDPSLGGIRLFERKEGSCEPSDAEKPPRGWRTLEQSKAIGPVVGWAHVLGRSVYHVVEWPFVLLRESVGRPLLPCVFSQARAPADLLASYETRDGDEKEAEAWGCYTSAPVDDLRLTCEGTEPCYWRAELTYFRPGAEAARSVFHGIPTLIYTVPRAYPLLYFDLDSVKRTWREYRSSRNARLFYTKILRIVPPPKLPENQVSESKEPSAEFEWKSGDTHVHTRYSDHFAESGHGTEATGRAATEIGLDWVMTTDHANDAEDLGMDAIRFREQSREIEAFNARAPSDPGQALLIQGEEIVVARRYDETDNVYHLLAYEWSKPDFVSGRIDPAGDQVGFWDLSQIFLGNAPQGKAQRTIEEIADQYSPEVGFALIAHPEEDYLEKAVKLQRKWTFEDFDVAIRHPSIRGMELWNTDIFEERNVYSFWERNTPDFHRVNNLGISRLLGFAPLAATNLVLSPFTYLLGSAGYINNPPLWGLSPRFDILIDPRFDTSTPVVARPEDRDRFFSSGFRASYLYARWFMTPSWASGFLDTGTPWAQTGIYDYFFGFSYRSFTSGIIAISVLTNFQNWVNKRGDEELVQDLEEFAEASTRLAWWYPSLARQGWVFLHPSYWEDHAGGTDAGGLEDFGSLWDSHCIVELPFREIRGDDSFWSRRIWPEPPSGGTARCPLWSVVLDEKAHEKIASAGEHWPVVEYSPIPWTRTPPPEGLPFADDSDPERFAKSATVEEIHAQDWYVVRERVATQKWVELYGGVDLWDYGIVARARQFLEDCPDATSCPVDASSTANPQDIADARTLAKPVDRLRFVAAAGTDAHGGFNYTVEQPTLYEVNINNSALGKVRTVAGVLTQGKEQADPEPILGAVAAGASYLSNGPHAEISVAGCPMGSVLVGTYDSLARLPLKIVLKEDRPKSDHHPEISDGWLYAGVIRSQETDEAFENYKAVFRRTSRGGPETARLMREFRYYDYLRRFYPGLCIGDRPWPCKEWEFVSEFEDGVSKTSKVAPGEAYAFRQAVGALWRHIERHRALISTRVAPFEEQTVADVLGKVYVGPPIERLVAYVRYEFDPACGGEESDRALTNPIWFVIEPNGMEDESGAPCPSSSAQSARRP